MASMMFRVAVAAEEASKPELARAPSRAVVSSMVKPKEAATGPAGELVGGHGREVKLRLQLTDLGLVLRDDAVVFLDGLVKFPVFLGVFLTSLHQLPHPLAEDFVGLLKFYAALCEIVDFLLRLRSIEREGPIDIVVR